jgi:C1A family cysteine protease
MPRKIQGYGWKPSLPDHRDLLADTGELKVLDEVDPRSEMQTPYDQSQLGSCTANAINGAIEYNYSVLQHHHGGTPSRLFLYYGERELEGSVNEDAGAYGRDGFKVAQKVGVPPERLWPYDINRFAERPPEEAYAEAARHRIGPYKSVPRNQTAWKQVLSNKQTIAFGFSVYESFESQEVARTGIMPVPTRSESQLGGHEVLAVGYLKSEPNYVLVRNSWGTDWGLDGYFLMPWAIVLDPYQSSDFWTIVRPLH